MSSDLAPAGWYPNPDGSGGLRWWSGVGWTEYTREGGPAGHEVTSEPAGVDEPVEPPASWGQPVVPGAPATPSTLYPPHSPYTPYVPPTAGPLTTSGMRPLNGMFGDMARIARRAWLPILGISAVIWGLVAVVYLAAVLPFVDLGALERGMNLLAAQSSPESGSTEVTPEISAAFRDAFAALPPSGWALLGGLLTLLLLVASTVHVAAVSRLGMDAAAGLRVSWGAGWKSGFTAGFRLLGYYLLIVVVSVVVVMAFGLLVAGLVALSPALGGVVAVMLLFALGVLSVWVVGRLIPLVCQAVVGSGALAWSWSHTRGKFWAVLGRYALWAIAASIVANVIVTIVSIPLSVLIIGSAANASASGQLGASLVLTLVTLPVSMALTAITTVGIVPIWRDLSDHPDYRAIDELGLPVEVA